VAPRDPLDPDPGPSRAALVRRAALRAGLVLLALVLLDAAWVGIRGYRAKQHLTAARTAVAQARADVAAGRLDEGLAVAEAVARDTAVARSLTSDAVWHANGHLPVIGSTFTTSGGLADAVDSVAAGALPELTSALSDVRTKLRVPGSTAVNLDVLREASRRLDAAQGGLAGARDRVAALPADPVVATVGSARAELLDTLDGLLHDVSGAAEAARLAPGMLGGDGPRRYFLALENTAEARGTGGIIGTYGIIEADAGRLHLAQSGSDADLPGFTTPVTDVSPEFTQRWRPLKGDTDWRDVTYSPHFPWTAQVVAAMWRKGGGQPVDGVLALEPTAAGYLVAATGPLRLGDGTTLTGGDLASYVESTLYARYPRDPEDQPARKAALVDLQRQLFEHLIRASDPSALLKALARAAGERRLLLASTHPQEQAELAALAIGGAMPDTPGPFAGAVLQNAIGNKMDYYLDRTLRWEADACPSAPGGGRTSTMTLTLHNDTPSGPLSSYVAAASRLDLRDEPAGTNRSLLSLYGSVGARPVAAQLDGNPVEVAVQSERGHPVVALIVDLPPRATRTVVASWDDPADGPVQPPLLQPLVRDPRVDVAVPACGG